MGYTSLNVYKKACEMKTKGMSDKEIMAELDLNFTQMIEINRVRAEYLTTKEFERQQKQIMIDKLLRNDKGI